MIRHLFNHQVGQLFNYRNSILRSINSNAQFMQSGSIDVPYQDGMFYGRGINRLNLEKPGSALIVSSIPEKQGGGQRQKLEATVVKNLDQLYEKLDISAKISGSVNLFSSKLSYRRTYESTLNSESTFVHVSQIISNPFEEIKVTNFSFTPQAQKILDEAYLLQAKGNLAESNKLLNAFRNAYGDMYVRGLYTGGYFSAILAVESTDKTEQDTVASSLSATFNMINADASFDQLIKSISKRVKINIIVDQQGGTGPNQSILLDGENTQDVFAQLMDRIEKFPKIVEEAPVPLVCQLATYKGLMPKLDFIDVGDQIDELEDYEKIRQQYFEQIHKINHIMNYKNLYSSLPSDNVLFSWQDFFKQKIDALEQLTEQCVRTLKISSTEVKYEEPEDYIIPLMVTEVSDQRESKLLGNVWHVKENLPWWNWSARQYKSVWKRRSHNSRVFDAETYENNGTPPADYANIKSTLVISIDNNVVNIDQYHLTSIDKEGNPSALNENPVTMLPQRCKYTGVVNADGAMEGRTSHCHGIGKSSAWSMSAINQMTPTNAASMATEALAPQQNNVGFWTNQWLDEQTVKNDGFSTIPKK